MEILLIKFTLAVIGIVCITNKSSLFLPLRNYLKAKHNCNTENKFWWFFASIFHCGMCMSVWAGIILYLPILLKFIYVDFIYFPLIGSALVTMSFKWYEKV